MTTPVNSGRVRRMASPSTKQLQGPIRATLPFGLGAGAGGAPVGSRSATSPTPPQWGTDGLRGSKSRRSPDHRVSPERASPISPGFKDRSKGLRHSPAPHPIKRTASLDTIATPYLKGEWPRPDPGVVGLASSITTASTCHNYCDKCTQTPAEWDDLCSERRRRTSHKRSSSLGNGDGLKKDLIKARLSKTKDGRPNVGTSRTSPVHPSYSLTGGAVISVQSLQTKAISIPQNPRHAARIRGSVEGPSQEIERLVSRRPGIEEENFTRTQEPTPDGHRAPIAEMLRCGVSTAATRSVDTQTPSGVCEETRRILEEEALPPHTPTPPSTSSSSNSSSGSHSESPGHFYISVVDGPPQDLPVTKGDEEEEERDNKSSKDSSSPEGTDSPDPKSFLFVREPPDGCEKVKVTVEEPRKGVPDADFYGPPLKETLQLCRIPSELSAFCPLLKPYVSQASDRAYKPNDTP